ncbi:NERD domain-containing protein [Flavobacterium sp. LaA7.5]|nr:NERD domain-containing protein [Flavobacterium salilacus subsp. altitudinum]
MMWIISIFFLVSFYFSFIRIKDYRLLKTVTKSNRGTRTERDLVLKLLKSGVPAEKIFHDLYLKMYRGNYSQIDLVVITEVGLIVFEVKNYSGWIFGTGYKSHWTQVLAFGKKKYRLYNPIMQNNKHVKDLKKQLKQENIPCFSVLVFYGDCVLKDINFVPDQTFLVKSDGVLGVLEDITKSNDILIYDDREVVEVLKKAVKNGSDKNIQIQHIENVKRMTGKDRMFFNQK